MDSVLVLPAGTVFYPSVVGHKNFVYPDSNPDTTIEPVEYTLLSFVGGGSKAPLKVSEHAIKFNGNPKKNVVIWVEKSEIL